jgi:hypothetical protein
MRALKNGTSSPQIFSGCLCMSAKVANNDWHNAAGRSKYRLWVLSFLV